MPAIAHLDEANLCRIILAKLSESQCRLYTYHQGSVLSDIPFMHHSFVITPPDLVEGGGIAGQMCHAFTFTLSTQYGDFQEDDIPGLTWQCDVKHIRLRGKAVVFFPARCARSVGVIAGNCRRKVKVTAVFRVWELWLQMADALGVDVV